MTAQVDHLVAEHETLFIVLVMLFIYIAIALFVHNLYKDLSILDHLSSDTYRILDLPTSV